MLRTVLLADRLIDGRNAEAIPDGAVVLSGEHVVWAGTAAGMPAGATDGATVHRFPGCSLLPGFVDAHTHFTQIGRAHV